MKNNTLEVVFILDKSGSMFQMTEDTIGGFNSVMAEHRKDGNSVLVSTVLFNDNHELIHDRLPIAKVPALTKEEYQPGGCTALIDAIGYSIKHIEEVHRYIRPEDVPGKTLFMITTDGLENASRRYASDEVKKMITAKQEAGWEFVFLAANIDAVETAKKYGIDERYSVSYHNDRIGTAKKFKAMEACIDLAHTCVELGGCPSWREETDKDFNSRK